MQTVEIVFTLPQYLVSLAQEAGLLTNTRLANWIEQELDRSHEASFGVDQSLEILRRENEVFARLQAELRVAYPNEFVAIHNGQVMDHDLNRRALFAGQLHYWSDTISPKTCRNERTPGIHVSKSRD